MKKSTIILKLLFFVLLCFHPFFHQSFAQTKQIDSLKNVISHAADDSLKVDNINQLTKLFFSIDPNIAIQYSESAEKIALKINYKSGLALAYKNMGIAYYMQSSYSRAIQIWDKSFFYYKELGDKSGQANIYSNRGVIYMNMSDDNRALDELFKSKTIAQEINDSLRLATVLLNMGSIQGHKKSSYDKAISTYLQSLPICEALGDKDALGTVLVNLGEIYYEKQNLDSALFYLEKSKFVYKGSENLPYSYIYIGKVYARKGDYEKAISYQDSAFNFAKKLNGKLDMTKALLALGNTYKQKGDQKNAINYFKRGIQFATEINANIELKELYQGISQTYSYLSDFNNAFKYQALLLNIKDTIDDNEKAKNLAAKFFNDDTRDRESKITLLTKDKEIQNQAIQRQKMIRNSFIIGFAIVIIFAGIFLKQRNKISKEKQRSEELLLNILPEETAEELKNTGTATAKSYDSVTVLFTDFKDFTKLSELLTPKELVAEISECFSAFDAIMHQYGIEKIKTIGDAYMAAGGLPTANHTHPLDVVKAAIAIREFMAEQKVKKEAEGKLFFRIRIGVHTGPVVSGVVGTKKFAYDIWGDTVNTASRMESSGEPGKVNISDVTYQLIKDQFNCVYRGKLAAKNKGEIDMYFVEDEIVS